MPASIIGVKTICIVFVYGLPPCISLRKLFLPSNAPLLTQTDAASVLGTTQQQIYRYEKGENEMTVGKLRELCLLYGVSADYILGLPKDLKWPC